MGEANAGWGCRVAVALCLAESRAERRAGSQVQSFPTSLRRCGQKSMQLRQKYRCARSKRQVWGGGTGRGRFLQSNEPVSMQHERENRTLFGPCK